MDLLNEVLSGLSELGVHTVRLNETQLQVFDANSSAPQVPFLLYTKPTAESEEDRNAIFLAIDIGVADPWLASAITVKILAVAMVILVSPVFKDSQGKLSAGNAAYTARDLAADAKLSSEDMISSEYFSEDHSGGEDFESGTSQDYESGRETEYLEDDSALIEPDRHKKKETLH